MHYTPKIPGLLGNAIRRNKREQMIITSTIWNTMVEVFKEEKNIDIRSYLVSIKYDAHAIRVKTGKPLINSELLLLNQRIKEKLKKKLQKMGLLIKMEKIKYL